jgi:hypothetical protein
MQQNARKEIYEFSGLWITCISDRTKKVTSVSEWLLFLPSLIIFIKSFIKIMMRHLRMAHIVIYIKHTSIDFQTPGTYNGSNTNEIDIVLWNTSYYSRSSKTPKYTLISYELNSFQKSHLRLFYWVIFFK